MNLLNHALSNLAQTLTKNNIPYMVIGGMANAVWGNPRATIDIDVTIWVEENKVKDTISLFKTVFEPMVASPQEFVKKTRVLPLKTTDGVQIDVIFGGLPYEYDAIQRAVEININEIPVCFCTAEDLILHKIISKRTRDLEDVKGILQAMEKKLDMEYLEPRVKELSIMLDNLLNPTESDRAIPRKVTTQSQPK